MSGCMGLINSDYRYISMKRNWCYDLKTFTRCIYLQPSRIVGNRKPTVTGQTTKAKIYNNEIRTGRRRYSFKVPLIKTTPNLGMWKEKKNVEH